jgi:glycosyltransferase involved in cell wall biosynthesis
MKLLLLSTYFPPEIGSASHLFHDMGREFVKRGHDVTVVTGYPTYNIDEKTLDKRYQTGLWMREEMGGMTIVRARLFRVPRAVPWLRGLQQVSGSFVSFFAGWFLAKRADMVLIYSPPLFLGLSGLALRLVTRAKVILNVQDLFPQAAIDLGVLRSGFLIGALRAMESFIYKRVDTVTVHSSGNKDHVMAHGGKNERTHVVPNVVDTDAVQPGPRMNAFRKEHGIPESEIVVSFAGVLGYSQDLDTVIDAARSLASIPEVKIYIVGEGVEKERLIAKAGNAPNIRFLPMLPKEQYVDLLHASDICLATLRSQVKTPVVPSKILSIMAAGRPVVAGMPLEGDAPQIVTDAACGMCVAPEDPAALAAAISSLSADVRLRQEMGVSGRSYVESHYSLSVCTALYDGIFAGLKAGR